MASVTQYLADSLGKWNQKQQGTGGAAHVRNFTGPLTFSHNRNLISIADTHPGLDTTNHVTWDSSVGITEVTLFPTAAGVAAVQFNDAFVAVVINAASAAIALAMLDLTIDSAVNDVQWIKIPIGIRTRIETESAITRLDFAVVVGGGYTGGSVDIGIGAN